jgi:SAM-dependent methyltransferase
MAEPPPGLAGHPDRLRWNARYETAGYRPSFRPHPLTVRVLSEAFPGCPAAGGPLPGGPVLELACGPSGSALLAAASGRHVTAVDVSDVALHLLRAAPPPRGLDHLITTAQADLTSWQPGPAVYALVLCTGYWDRDVFRAAARAVRDGGALAWEALTLAARRERPQLPAQWCLQPGEPASLLPADCRVLSQDDIGQPATRRQLLAVRAPG